MSLNNQMRRDDGQDWDSSSGEGGDRQNSNGGNDITTDDSIGQQQPQNCSKEESESKARRESIKQIMHDPNLTNNQRRFSIQLLMDGRRRSSYGQTFAEAARNVAAEFAECDEDADDSPHPISVNNISVSSALERRVSSYSVDNEFSSDALAKNSCPMVAYTLKGEPTGDPKLLEKNRPQCDHYQRNCSIISPCCGMVFSCRLCHDECQTLSIPFMNGLRQRSDNTKDEKLCLKVDGGAASMTTATSSLSKEMNEKSLRRRISNRSLRDNAEDVHHEIDRHSISEVICRKCFTRQSSKTNNCVNCKVQFGEYHCSICNLWMDNLESPYHCEGCGICRVGGRENFVHCDICGMCIDKTNFNEHSCKVGKYMNKCPVCYEDLFSSRSACHELPCKHSIHWQCFCNLLSVDIRCPICKKTMLPDDEKEDIWDGLREDINAQPVPPDQTRVVDIFCNDCEIREGFRRWHPLGVSCRECNGFNTSIDITMVGTEAFNFLQRLERENNNDNENTDRAGGG